MQKTCSNCKYCVRTSPASQGTFIISSYICTNLDVGLGMPVYLEDPSIKDCFVAKEVFSKDNDRHK